jgi:Ca2+-binding RTX toxin-like protein
MKRRLELEALEERSLLSVSATLVGRELVITGTEQGDVITVTQTQVLVGFQAPTPPISGLSYRAGIFRPVYADGVQVTIGSGLIFLHPRLLFRASAFDLIRVNAGGGDDRVTNNSPYRSVMDGGAGNDVLTGGSGNDEFTGGIGNDVLYGGWGNDALYGGDHADALYGNQGNDWLEGGRGADIFDGGSGSDTGKDRAEDQAASILLASLQGEDYGIESWIYT